MRERMVHKGQVIAVDCCAQSMYYLARLEKELSSTMPARGGLHRRTPGASPVSAAQQQPPNETHPHSACRAGACKATADVTVLFEKQLCEHVDPTSVSRA